MCEHRLRLRFQYREACCLEDSHDYLGYLNMLGHRGTTLQQTPWHKPSDAPWSAAIQEHGVGHEFSRSAGDSMVLSMKKDMGLVISPWHAEWDTISDNRMMGSSKVCIN